MWNFPDIVGGVVGPILVSAAAPFCQWVMHNQGNQTPDLIEFFLSAIYVNDGGGGGGGGVCIVVCYCNQTWNCYISHHYTNLT